MASLTCSFCNHANPAGARFCNECGSGLGLRPCARCDAINDVGASYCHQCGALLNERVATSVGGAAQSSRAADAVSESSVVRALGEVAPEAANPRAASPPSVKELSSAAERLDAFWRDSMQAVEVARTMKPDAADSPAARPVEVLPLRVDGESPVIDVASRYRRDGRGSARAALAFVVLAVVAAAAYYSYEQSTPRRSAPATSAPIVVSPPAQSAPATQQPAPTVTEASPTQSPVAAPAATESAAAPQASPAPAAQQPDTRVAVPAVPEAVAVTALPRWPSRRRRVARGAAPARRRRVPLRARTAPRRCRPAAMRNPCHCRRRSRLRQPHPRHRRFPAVRAPTASRPSDSAVASASMLVTLHRITAALVATALIGYTTLAHGAAAYKIVTASERGTVHPDRPRPRAIRRAATPDIELEALPSAGSAENVQRLRYEPGVKFALVQSDVYQAFLDQAGGGNARRAPLIRPLRVDDAALQRGDLFHRARRFAAQLRARDPRRAGSTSARCAAARR